MQDDEKILLGLIIVGGVIFGIVALVAVYIFFVYMSFNTPVRPIAIDGAGSTSPASPGTSVAPTSSTVKKCVIGGCSGELCTDASAGDVQSICIYKDEFACYKESFAKCEVQKSGECGWTENDEMKKCLGAN